MRVLALLDGTLADPDAPLVRADDLTVTRGDGVFETILVVDREPRELGPHLDRLRNSADLLDLPLPERAGWERAVRAVIDNWSWESERELAVKIVCSRGVDGDETPHGFALGTSVGPDTLRKRRDGVAAVTLDRGYAPDLKDRAPWLLLSAKTLSYAVNMAVLRHVKSLGAQEAIFTASNRRILEGATSSVVVARRDQGRLTLFTPEPNHGILPGTTQGALFEGARDSGWDVGFGPLYPKDLMESDGVWLTSSVRLLAPVTHL